METARTLGFDPPFTHGGRVKAIAFCPRGRRLATIGHDALRLWWVATGEPIAAPVAGVSAALDGLVFFDPTGERVVAFQRGTEGPGLTWWSASTGEVVRRVGGPGKVLAVSRDRRFVATQHGGNAKMQVWDLDEEKPVLAVHGAGAREVSAAAFTPDASRILIAYRPLRRGTGGRMERWNIAGAQREAHRNALTHARWIQFLDDGERAAIAFEGDGVPGIAIVRRDLTLWTTPRVVGVVRTAELLPDRRVLYATAAAGLLLQSVESGDGLRVFAGRSEWTTLAVDSTGSRAASADAQGRVMLWDLATEEPIAPALPIAAHVVRAYRACDAATPGVALAAGERGQLERWDLDTGTLLQRFGESDLRIAAVRALDDGRVMSAGTDVAVWELDRGAPIQRLALPSPAARLEVAPGGALALVVLAHERAILVLEHGGAEWRIAHRIDEGVGDAPLVACWIGGGRLVSSDEDLLSIWDARAGRRLRSMPPIGARITALAATSDGTRIAAGCASGEVVVLDVESGGALRRLRSRGAVTGLAWSEAGRRLVVARAEGDRLAELSLESGEVERQLAIEGTPAEISVSTDGARLVAAGGDGRLRVWGQPR